MGSKNSFPILTTRVWFAVVKSVQTGELIPVPLHEIGQLAEETAPVGRVHDAPVGAQGERSAGGSHSQVHVGAVALGNLVVYDAKSSSYSFVKQARANFHTLHSSSSVAGFSVENVLPLTASTNSLSRNSFVYLISGRCIALIKLRAQTTMVPFVRN